MGTKKQHNEPAKVVNKNEDIEELPLRFAWKEPQHADDEEIVPKRFFAEVLPTWKGGQFNPNAMNAGTGSAFKKSHHVKGAAGKGREDFKDGTFGFCLEFIDVPFNGKVYRVRCLNQFTVHSQQCIDHPKAIFKDGPNKIYDLLAAGRLATYGMIKDKKIEIAEVPPPAEQQKQKALEDNQVILDRMEKALANREDITHLLAAQAANNKLIGGKANGRSDMAPATARPLSSRPTDDSVPIYSSRRSASKSAPGDPLLDAKALRNPNLKTRRTLASKLQTVTEEAPKEKKKGKKNTGLDLA